MDSIASWWYTVLSRHPFAHMCQQAHQPLHVSELEVCITGAASLNAVCMC